MLKMISASKHRSNSFNNNTTNNNNRSGGRRSRRFPSSFIRYFRSSDFGYQKVKNGPIYFVGRRDQQVKIRGHRVECMEVESLLKSSPNVNKCAVVASNVLNNTMQLFMFCTLIDKTLDIEKNTTNVIYEWCKTNIPLYMIPSRIIILAFLPLLPNGKLDRNSLKEIVQKQFDVKHINIQQQRDTTNIAPIKETKSSMKDM